MKISCVVPAYQNVTLLRRCLDSLLNQQYVPFEVLVTDDSYDDAVADLVAPLVDADPRVRYTRGPRTGNAADNWNAGLDLAVGRHLILVHQDDWFAAPDYLSAVDASLDSAPPGSCLYAKTRVVGGLRASRYEYARKLARRLGNAPWTLYAMNWIGPPTAFICPAEKRVRYDHRLKALIDVDYYVRAIGDGPLLPVQDGVICSGVHDQQISAGMDIHQVCYNELRDLRPSSTVLRGVRGWIVTCIMLLRLIASKARPIIPRAR